MSNHLRDDIDLDRLYEGAQLARVPAGKVHLRQALLARERFAQATVACFLQQDHLRRARLRGL